MSTEVVQDGLDAATVQRLADEFEAQGHKRLSFQQCRKIPDEQRRVSFQRSLVMEILSKTQKPAIPHLSRLHTPPLEPTDAQRRRAEERATEQMQRYPQEKLVAGAAGKGISVEQYAQQIREHLVQGFLHD